jgi:hypothetical protein
MCRPGVVDTRRMAHGHRIFQRAKLKPSQLRTVADRRLADARTLRQTERNERANGVMYLGGFVIECLLKAQLLETFRWLQSAPSAVGRSRDEQRLWSLCYRSHELDEILARLPAVRHRILLAEQRGQAPLLHQLQSICAQWSIHARYSPYSAMLSEAIEFLERVKELMEWLK